ncbi:GRAS domain-containing protein, partial [Psidium guajava]
VNMDPRFKGCSASVAGLSLDNQSLPWFGDPSLVPGPRFETSGFRGGIQYVPTPVATQISGAPSAPNSCMTQEEDSPEDCDFSDAVLRYISEMLMEEDMEEKSCMLQESLDLQAAEKSLYDAIGKKYPPSPKPIPNYTCPSGERPEDDLSVNRCSCLMNNPPVSYSCERISFPQEQSLSFHGIFQSSYTSSNSVVGGMDGFVDSPASIAQVPDLGGESQSIWQFQKGVEEASKFLPGGNGFFDNVESKGSLTESKVGSCEVAVKLERKDDCECSPNGSRGRKNPHRVDADFEEERRSKQAAVFSESPLRSVMFDNVLLCPTADHITVLQETLQDGTTATMLRNGQPKGLNGGKGRGIKHNGKREVVDLRTLLINCAQAVAADNRLSTSDFLKQIRQHSSPFGDGNQRLAHCLADGLEARQAGTGSQIYKGLISKRTSAADILKAYHLFLAACPFRKLSNFTANKTIMSLASDSMRIHIIDFGVLYGFQWPTLIQRLSARHGGPPKIRITGIDFPQPGFRPAERVEETGRRLAAYAEHFKVPFEYNAIAKKWENIQIDELKIDKDELLVVNCIYRSKNLLDESVAADSSRNMVFNLIRRINPDIFIHGILNGSYNAPFFVTRFREALFHFSALFDMLETLVPRENRERMLLEKEIFGREALNVIACEGWERVERPETYKQWQLRNLRAGFVQVPFDRDIVKRATEKVRSSYHKDFMIDEDGRWLLHGWKGRIIYALSAWKPV